VVPFIQKICIILLGGDASYRTLVQELILFRTVCRSRVRTDMDEAQL